MVVAGGMENMSQVPHYMTVAAPARSSGT
ncbi:MAG: hypothetical protein R2810_11735 [Flavobacteriales bacterium]